MVLKKEEKCYGQTLHQLHLSDQQLQDLHHLRDTGEPAYLRERAAALLKIAAGSSPHRVAQRGLLKKRKPDTVYTWLRHYREHGVMGLRHKPGKGRKPAFAPLSERRKSETPRPHRSRTRPCCLHMRHAGRFAPSAHRCLGSMICQYQGCEASSAVSASAISVADPICGVPMVNAEKIASVKQALQQSQQNPETHVAFYQDEFADFDDSRRSQKIGHRPAQSTHSPTKAYTTMRPVMASVPSRTHGRSGLSTNRQVPLSWQHTHFTPKSVCGITQG